MVEEGSSFDPYIKKTLHKIINKKIICKRKKLVDVNIKNKRQETI